MSHYLSIMSYAFVKVRGSYSLINVTSPLQVHLPSVLTDGLVNALSLWTLVPFKESLYVKRNVAEANKEKQLVNRQLKLTANEPVTIPALLMTDGL